MCLFVCIYVLVFLCVCVLVFDICFSHVLCSNIFSICEYININRCIHTCSYIFTHIHTYSYTFIHKHAHSSIFKSREAG